MEAVEYLEDAIKLIENIGYGDKVPFQIDLIAIKSKIQDAKQAIEDDIKSQKPEINVEYRRVDYSEDDDPDNLYNGGDIP
jgi:hypothetical protein